MPYLRDAEAVLADWRAVKRDMIDVNQGIAAGESLNIEFKALHAEAKRLRIEYQRLVEEARGHQRRIPPPFPTDAEAEAS